jgi:hypothetical protein
MPTPASDVLVHVRVALKFQNKIHRSFPLTVRISSNRRLEEDEQTEFAAMVGKLRMKPRDAAALHRK